MVCTVSICHEYKWGKEGGGGEGVGFERMNQLQIIQEKFQLVSS